MGGWTWDGTTGRGSRRQCHRGAGPYDGGGDGEELWRSKSKDRTVQGEGLGHGVGEGLAVAFRGPGRKTA